jgi:hypothetical protein
MAKEIAIDQLTPDQIIQLSRRGRSSKSVGSPTSGVGTGLRVNVQNMLGEAAQKVASKPQLPVINVQKRKGLRLDPRSFGGKKTIAEKMGAGVSPRQITSDISEGGDPDQASFTVGAQRPTGDTGGDVKANMGDAGRVFSQGGTLVSDFASNLASGAAGTLTSGALQTVVAKGMNIPGAGDIFTNAIGKSFQDLWGVNAINELVGTIVSDYIGNYTASNLNIDTSTLEGKQIAEEAKRGALDAGWLGAIPGLSGLSGMALRGLGSWIGNKTGLFEMDSPMESAQKRALSTQSSQKISEEFGFPGQYTPPTNENFLQKAVGFITDPVVSNLSAPDANALAQAGPEITESGAIVEDLGFSPVNNLSNAYQQTGVDMFGNPTSRQSSKKDDPVEYSGPTGADAPGGYGTDTYDIDYGAAGSKLGGDGWADLGGGVRGDFSGERDASGNAISG